MNISKVHNRFKETQLESPVKDLRGDNGRSISKPLFFCNKF